eukprot:g26077.t1
MLLGIEAYVTVLSQHQKRLCHFQYDRRTCAEHRSELQPVDEGEKIDCRVLSKSFWEYASFDAFSTYRAACGRGECLLKLDPVPRTSLCLDVR